MLTGKARLAGVIGWPVSHSRSPRLHGFWLDELGIDGAYVPLPVTPEDFPAIVAALPRMGFVGANITVPHKEAALALVDEIDGVAARIGAINTLVVLPDGRIEGQNTDAFGFMANLRAGAPQWRAESGPAVVLGAGGAARAVVAGLQDAGIPQIRLVNRSQERAEKLAAAFGGSIQILPWSQRATSLDGAALLINTTTLGMVGAPTLDLDLSALPISAVVTDIVYVPLETPLLAAARQRGHPVVDGIGMLLWQAVPGFEAWFGIRPTITPTLRRFVLG